MNNLPSEIIPDANILFSFFKIESVRRNIFRELLKIKCKFFAPNFVFDELLSDKEKIKKSASINEKEFSYLFQLLNKEINSLSNETYKSTLSKALGISPHTKDIPYFAVALLKNIPI